MTEGLYTRVKDRNIVGIISKDQGLYGSLTSENEGPTVLTKRQQQQHNPATGRHIPDEPNRRVTFYYTKILH